MIKTYGSNRERRQVRVRAKIAGRSTLPRLVVSRSNKYIFAQIVDGTGKSLAGVRKANAEEAGKLIAEKALAAKIKAVVFDRGGYTYHGRVKAVAEAARKAGLNL